MAAYSRTESHDDVAGELGVARRLYRQRGIGESGGFGKRPAVLVIDMQLAFTDPRYKLGMNQDAGISAIASMLVLARREGIPVFYAVTRFREDLADSMMAKKAPALAEIAGDSPGIAIDQRLTPEPGDYVIEKKHSSCFNSTELLPLLISQQIDTVLVVGCSTSGCVRASAVDASAYGFTVVVPESVVSDRAEAPHNANLFDINSKYGDVIPLSEVLAYMERIHRREML